MCTLALEVENDNENAARLYERLGFEEKGVAGVVREPVALRDVLLWKVDPLEGQRRRPFFAGAWF